MTNQQELPELRHYQEAAIQAVLSGLSEGQQRLLVCLAPGLGTSLIIVALLTRLLNNNQTETVNIVVNRVYQKDHLRALLQKCYEFRERIQITTRHAFVRKAEQGRFKSASVTVSIDCGTGLTQHLLNRSCDTTPLILFESVPTSELAFGHPVYQYGVQQATVDGFLVPVERIRIPSSLLGSFELALSNNSVLRSPDFVEVAVQFLGEHLDPARLGKTVIYCVDEEHSLLVIDQLRGVLRARYPGFSEEALVNIAGTNPNSDHLIQRFQIEEYPKIAVTVKKLSHTFLPAVDQLVFFSRITSSVAFHRMLSIGYMPCESINKESLCVIDFAQHSELNGTLELRDSEFDEREELLNRLHTLSYRELLDLVTALFRKRGYESIESVGDDGRGVLLELVIDTGFRKYREIIRVDYDSSPIEPEHIDQLRGCLSRHNAVGGIVISLGSISEHCHEIQYCPGALPVTLMNGEMFLDSLLESGLFGECVSSVRSEDSESETVRLSVDVKKAKRYAHRFRLSESFEEFLEFLNIFSAEEGNTLFTKAEFSQVMIDYLKRDPGRERPELFQGYDESMSGEVEINPQGDVLSNLATVVELCDQNGLSAIFHSFIEGGFWNGLRFLLEASDLTQEFYPICDHIPELLMNRVDELKTQRYPIDDFEYFLADYYEFDLSEDGLGEVEDTLAQVLIERWLNERQTLPAYIFNALGDYEIASEKIKPVFFSVVEPAIEALVLGMGMYTDSAIGGVISQLAPAAIPDSLERIRWLYNLLSASDGLSSDWRELWTDILWDWAAEVESKHERIQVLSMFYNLSSVAIDPWGGGLETVTELARSYEFPTELFSMDFEEESEYFRWAPKDQDQTLCNVMPLGLVEALTGISSGTLRKGMKSKSLTARKLDNRYVVSLEELSDYLASQTT